MLHPAVERLEVIIDRHFVMVRKEHGGEKLDRRLESIPVCMLRASSIERRFDDTFNDRRLEIRPRSLVSLSYNFKTHAVC